VTDDHGIVDALRIEEVDDMLSISCESSRVGGVGPVARTIGSYDPCVGSEERLDEAPVIGTSGLSVEEDHGARVTHNLLHTL
jgi:hypothetical protein